MNLKAIKDIINEQTISEETKAQMILSVISEDKNAIPYILTILTNERNTNRLIISDLNLEVSRYHIHTQSAKLLKINKEFLNEQTKTLYEKWKDFIQPLFNNKF